MIEVFAAFTRSMRDLTRGDVLWQAAWRPLAAFASLTYVTAILLVAVFALPHLIDLVAAHHYPDLGRNGENVWRTFRFDALAEHATRAEVQSLIAENRSSFYIAGLGTAAAAHVPVLNLLAPAFAALVFVHLGLATLRRRRQQGGVVL